MNTSNNLNYGQLRSKLNVGAQHFYFKFKCYNPVYIQKYKNFLSLKTAQKERYYEKDRFCCI